MDDLTPEAIETALQGSLGRPLRVFDTIASTNPEAMGWAGRGAREGALVVADHQTAGRGRGGRTWASAPGSALQFSLVLRPRTAPERLGLLTTALGLACAEAVADLSGIPARLKWPNDVVCGGRKVSGCLVETKIDGATVAVAVAGMGVNVTSAPLPAAVAATATSIADEGGEAPARPVLLAAILARFESLYPLVTGPEAGSDELVRRAQGLSDLVGRDVEVTLPGGETLIGRALGLDPVGALRIESGGEELTLRTGDVHRVRRTDRIPG